jgi:hypothetical protein
MDAPSNPNLIELEKYPQCSSLHRNSYLGSVWLKSQVERSHSVPVLLLFGYKGTRTELLQLGNILLRSGTIPLQKINGTEPLRSHPALTVTLRSVHSATKQKTEPLCSRLPNTEQSDSVPRIRDGTAPFYLALQPNTTLFFFLRRLHPALMCYCIVVFSSALTYGTSCHLSATKKDTVVVPYT